MNFAQSAIIILGMGTCSLLTGWLTLRFLFSPEKLVRIAGLQLQGIIPSLMESIRNSHPLPLEHLSINKANLNTVLAQPSLYESMRPTIEKHVDHFLQEKLSSAFPLLYKFMGEKTLAQFRTVFLAEIDELFPEIMQQYGATVLEKVPFSTIIGEQLSGNGNHQVISFIRKKTLQKRRIYMGICTISGLLMGILLVLICHAAG